MKKGDVWISAVLYLALGMIVISLILTAAIPLINRMKDRNTVIQTKKVMYTLDDAIRTVVNEGPGSQRELSPFIINSGKLFIRDDKESVNWSLETNAVIIEPGSAIREGTLDISLDKTPVSEKFIARLGLLYTNINLTLNSTYSNPFSGSYTAIIKHTGLFTSNMPLIEIRMV